MVAELNDGIPQESPQNHRHTEENKEPQKKKVVSEATEERNQIMTFFGRTRDGFYPKTTDEQKEQAKEALETYSALEKSEQIEFAKAFQSNTRALGGSRTSQTR